MQRGGPVRLMARFWYPVYLLVWETGAVGETYEGGGLSASTMYAVLLWTALSLGFSIYVFINHLSHREGGTQSLSNANTLALLAHNERAHAGSLPLVLSSTPPHTPWPNTHTHTKPAPLTCYPWRRDSGRLIFSATHRLITIKIIPVLWTWNNSSRFLFKKINK